MGIRQATHDTGFTIIDNRLIGVNLGWDFTAEHEWGIKVLKESFGVKDDNISKLGWKKRLITRIPEQDFMYFDDGKLAVLLYLHNYFHYSRLKGLYDSLKATKSIQRVMKDYPNPFDNLRLREGVDIAAGWNEESFGIIVRDEPNRGYLETIYDVIINKDAVMFLGGKENPFSNAGLCLGIFSAFTGDMITAQETRDADLFALQRSAEHTGIAKKLDKARNEWIKSQDNNFNICPKAYYALTPRWCKEEEKGSTKYPVIFWLNPFDQEHNKWGWYTVEELESWLNDLPNPITKKE